MNRLILQIFSGFTIDGVQIPVKWIRYDGHGEPYVVFMHTDSDSSLSGDDDLIGYVDYYDFDIYSTGNYEKIINEVKQRLKANNFVWQPSRSSEDLYDEETGYYHKTLCFAYLREDV